MAGLSLTPRGLADGSLVHMFVIGSCPLRYERFQTAPRSLATGLQGGVYRGCAVRESAAYVYTPTRRSH
eukprot:3870285-Pyramimonas_sp.AAC.1